MTKDDVDIIESQIIEKLDYLLLKGGWDTRVTVGFMIETAKTEVKLVCTLQRLTIDGQGA
ncbi:MAG TPA: hypothetical protein VF974_04105 [Patescibacteria group bacterium]